MVGQNSAHSPLLGWCYWGKKYLGRPFFLLFEHFNRKMLTI